MTTKIFKRFLYWVEIMKNPKENLGGRIILYDESYDKIVKDRELRTKFYTTGNRSFYADYYNPKALQVCRGGFKVMVKTSTKTVKMFIPYRYVQDIYIYGYNNGCFNHKYPDNLR